MKNKGIEYTLPGNTNPWGYLHDSELVEENYEGLVRVTDFLVLFEFLLLHGLVVFGMITTS